MIKASSRFSERYVVLIGTERSYQVFHFAVDQKQEAKSLFKLSCQVPQLPVTWIDTQTGRIVRRSSQMRQG